MSDFKEWFNSQDMPMDISLMRTESGFILRREVTPILHEGAKFAWEYQQEIIEKLKAENEKLRECLWLYVNPENWSEDYMRQGNYVRHPKIGLSIDGGDTGLKLLKELENEK